MTHPSDPGQSQPPGASGHPYGPPPQPPSGPEQHAPPYQRPGPVPGQRPPAPDHPRMTGPQQAWGGPQAPAPRDKGLFGALFDTNFDHLVTPKLIKVFYVLSLLLVTLWSLVIVAIGLWISDLRNGWLLGLIVLATSPVFWFFGAIMSRIFMEALVVRFKGVEHLRVIRDKI